MEEGSWKQLLQAQVCKNEECSCQREHISMSLEAEMDMACLP